MYLLCNIYGIVTMTTTTVCVQPEQPKNFLINIEGTYATDTKDHSYEEPLKDQIKKSDKEIYGTLE